MIMAISHEIQIAATKAFTNQKHKEFHANTRWRI